MVRPCFLITIDTEGDHLWSRPKTVTTRNAEFLERFQLLCERYDLRPTWLTNYEMISSPTYRRFAADVIARGTAEIGMHLHAWDSPPLEPLTADDTRSHPYLIEYPPRVMREKIHRLTVELEDALGVKMISHRAGRWAFDERYAEMLLDEGYRVDCSVTPLVSWANDPGVPMGRGGTDYTNFPHEPYWVDLDDISRPGSSPLLEVPVTILSFRPAYIRSLLRLTDRIPLPPVHVFARRAANRLFPPATWLRPTGRNRHRLLEVIERVVAEQLPHAEFMLHSSELMPMGSPTFPTRASVEALYADLEILFGRVQHLFRAATLRQFYDEAAIVTGGQT
jgi:peptidoglycan/xylan/chitin deacetylase (PgdA/CDA1 family)